jgi:glycosyltransferase involved in cell wall biosynthesis
VEISPSQLEGIEMTPRICLIVGDPTTQYCGVKNYAERLGKALGDIGLNAELAAPPDWGIKSFPNFCETLRRQQFDIVHVQYPSIGNRSSLLPHFLGLMRVAKGVVVTLHEYSAMPMLQRLSTHLFRFTSDQLLFTVDAESIKYGRSWKQKLVIPIGSNVPAFSSKSPRMLDVLYFGQIRPNKGLEEFLELASRSKQHGKPFRYRVVGSVAPRRAEYYDALRTQATPGVEWLIGLSFERVAELMASSLAAYLPYPDGASYRRGSLLAALTNGLPPITTINSETPREMLGVLLSTKGPDEALLHLERLIADPGHASAISEAGRTFAERFSWTEIARQHELVYTEELNKVGPSRQRPFATRTATEH